VNGGLVTGVGIVGNPSLGVSMSVIGGVLAPGNPFGTLTSAGANGFAMGGAATLSISLGSSNQFSQLAVTGGGMNLNGTLNVTLVNGYTPAIGTQFQIVNGTPHGGFVTLNLPQGISLNYSNAGVYLVVTSAVPAQVESPLLSGNNFTFTFGPSTARVTPCNKTPISPRPPGPLTPTSRGTARSMNSLPRHQCSAVVFPG